MNPNRDVLIVLKAYQDKNNKIRNYEPNDFFTDNLDALAKKFVVRELKYDNTLSMKSMRIQLK